MVVKLGELLLSAKLVTPEQVEAALKSQREEGGKFGEALIRLGAVSETDITETLSQQFGVPSIDLAHFEIDPTVIKVVPGEVARKYGVLPVNKTGATLTIAMSDPTNVFAMDDIKFMTGYNVEPVVASEASLRRAIDKHYGTPRSVVLKERPKGATTGSAPSDGSGGIDDLMSSALTIDDMASVGLSEMNMDEITGFDTGEVDVVRGEEGQEIDLTDLAKSSESAPIIKVSNLILIEALKASWLIYGTGFRQSWLRSLAKRAFDVAVAATLLILTLPIIAVTALLIGLEGGPPVIYRQERVGLRGKTFNLLKFRSMEHNAEKDGKPTWAAVGDKRITKLGRFLRRSRIDELPQLINVLRGEMSFVGPRPERPIFVAMLSEKIPFYAVRHSIKPGLTGWAQVRYSYGATVEESVTKLEYDLYYVKNHTVFLDLLIMLETVRVVLLGEGAR